MRITAAAIALTLVLPLGGPATATVGPTPEQSIAAMAFLSGAWVGQAWGGEFHAYYSTPDGGKVLSYSELSVDGKVVYHEFERFEARRGEVVFTPFPKGKPANELRLLEIDVVGGRVVFENPDKDFPTRIVYHRVSSDNLVIMLSDPYGGSDKIEKFDLRRPE